MELSTSSSGLSSTVLRTQGRSAYVIQGPGTQLSKFNATPLNLNVDSTADSSMAANVTTAANGTTTLAPFVNTISDSSNTQKTSYVNGSSAIQSCYTAWAEWGNEFYSWYGEGQAPYYLVETWTYWVTEYSTFTLCDGWPRVDAAPFTTWISTDQYSYPSNASGLEVITVPTTVKHVIPTPAAVLTSYYTATVVTITSYNGPGLLVFTSGGSDYSVTPTFPVPTPDCEIAPTDCMSLVYSVFYAQFTAPQSTPLPPNCDFNIDDVIYSGGEVYVGSPCTLFVPTVELI